jgi:hypothetical protein
MKRFTLTKSFAAAGFVLGALGAASTAHARSDVYFSVGVQSPDVYVQPAPVYVQPRPVYVAPQPVYQPGHYGQHRYEDDRGRYDSHAWQRRGPYGDHDRDGVANVYDPDSPRNQRRWARLYGPYGDLDRDGVMNMDDRDRDGDGVRNRHDRFPDDPHRY